MLIRSVCGSAAAVIGCVVVAGCLAPSDPEGPPVGIRVENGVLTVYMPLCPEERLVSAQVDDPHGNGTVLWKGERPAKPDEKIVQLGGSAWGQQSGAFIYNGQDFSLDITGTVRTYGSSRDGRRLIADLPPGSYDLDGKKITAAELDAQSDCKKTS